MGKDKMMCAVCEGEIELDKNGYVHKDKEQDKDHAVRPVMKGNCCG